MNNPTGSSLHAVLGQQNTIQVDWTANTAQTIHLAWEFFQRRRADHVAHTMFEGYKTLLIQTGRHFPTTSFVMDLTSLTERFFLAWHLSEMLEWFWEHSSLELERKALSTLIGGTLAEGLRCISLCTSKSGVVIRGWSGHAGPYMLILGARMCLRDKNDGTNRVKTRMFLDMAVESLCNIPVAETRMNLYRQLCVEYRRVGAWGESVRWGIEACKVNHVPPIERLWCFTTLVLGWYPR